MSYFLAFAVNDTAPPVDGPQIASSMGFHDWGSFVLARGQDFPECAYFAEHGWVDEGVPGSLSRLEAELPRLEAAAKSIAPDVASVTTHLLAGLKERPPQAVGVLVTDGEPGEDERSVAYPESDIFG